MRRVTWLEEIVFRVKATTESDTVAKISRNPGKNRASMSLKNIIFIYFLDGTLEQSGEINNY